MEHLHHFDLSQDPFQNEPDLRFYFDSAFHRDVQLRMDRGLRQHKGFCILTGEGGTGKTLLARRILDSLEEEVFDANLMVMLAGAADAESVLSRFARQVGVEETSADRSALLAQIYEQLAIVREDGRHCVLILDDAQILTREAMAEIGGLLNLEYEDRRLLSLLLVGLPDLDVAISQDPSLAQRVDVRGTLRPLDLENATAYLRHRLSVVGGSPEIFSQEAVAALYKFSRGRPRLLNTLADNSLFEAFLETQKRVAAVHVERAAGDLGIGADPGTTYQSLAVERPPAAPPPAAPAATAPPPAALEPAAAPPNNVAAPGEDDGIDLGALLDDSPESEGDLTVLTLEEPAAEAGTRDLDLDLSAPLDEELPAFESLDLGRSPSADAPTRVALAPEPSVVQGDDEIDDLFVELIEE